MIFVHVCGKMKMTKKYALRREEAFMVKHMIIWKFNDGLDNKAEKALEIKKALEGLLGNIDGLTKMEIIINL